MAVGWCGGGSRATKSRLLHRQSNIFYNGLLSAIFMMRMKNSKCHYGLILDTILSPVEWWDDEEESDQDIPVLW